MAKQVLRPESGVSFLNVLPVALPAAKTTLNLLTGRRKSQKKKESSYEERIAINCE